MKTGIFSNHISISVTGSRYTFSVKSFGSIITIGISFLGFYFEPKNDGSCKKSKQNTKKQLLDENVTFP